MVDIGTVEWILGLLIPLLIASVAATFKYRADAQGWKISYEHEKEASARAERKLEQAELATDIANKTAEALHKLAEGRR